MSPIYYKVNGQSAVPSGIPDELFPNDLRTRHYKPEKQPALSVSYLSKEKLRLRGRDWTKPDRSDWSRDSSSLIPDTPLYRPWTKNYFVFSLLSVVSNHSLNHNSPPNPFDWLQVPCRQLLVRSTKRSEEHYCPKKSTYMAFCPDKTTNNFP